MTDDTIRCRTCGAPAPTELVQIDATLSAASVSKGEVRVIYTATARALLRRLQDQIDNRVRAVEHLEQELARVAAAEGRP